MIQSRFARAKWTRSTCAGWLLLAVSLPAVAAEPTREEVQFFEAKIRPVLVRECYGCHSNQAGNVRGGLRLDTRELTHIGGATGPAIVPGKPEESWLYNAITHQDFEMPPKRKLPANVIADFKRWIEMGAPDPRSANIAKTQSSISKEDIREASQTFWAYQSPVKPAEPEVKRTSWPASTIDRHILAKLESEGMEPTGDAEPAKVLRRLSFDLVGLPPRPEQIEYFQSKWREDPQQAVAEVVDRLLRSEQFGERWGRHWLDVVRYAESTGREVNMTYPHAWRYRDYVIDSFNQDKPFDQFIQEQIAGDLLPAPTDEKWTENLVATTFLAIGSKNVNEQNRVQFAADVIDEQIDATTRVFLGMSVACARCHDHKFDAIPQTDYYAMAGIFGNMTTYYGNPQSKFGAFSSAQQRQNSSLIILPVEDPNPYDKRYTSEELSSLEAELTDKLREIAELRRNQGRGNGGGGQSAIINRLRLLNELSRLSNKLGVVDEEGNPRSYCMGVLENQGQPQDARLLVRGEIGQPAQSVPRGLPQVISDSSVSFPSDSSGRLELARWLGSDKNPLAARVMVNRIWQHLIGQGIVTSTENFGVTGQPPSHPELLDYLAIRFVDSGWSVKTIIREITASRTYRMQTSFRQTYHEMDPGNALLWRANPRRLDAEAIRDAMLSVSGEIDFQRPRGSEVAKAGYTRVRNGVLGDPRELAAAARERMRKQAAGGFGGAFGGGFGRPGQRPLAMAMQRFGAAIDSQLDMEDAKFRSVYLPIVRDEEPRALEVFDIADTSSVTGTRESSNTANQALFMMNNPFVLQQSDAFARRIAGQSGDPATQIQQAFLLAYGRQPTTREREAASKFVREFAASTSYRNRGQATLSALCQSLFASAEFRYID